MLDRIGRDNFINVFFGSHMPPYLLSYTSGEVASKIDTFLFFNGYTHTFGGTNNAINSAVKVGSVKVW